MEQVCILGFRPRWLGILLHAASWVPPGNLVQAEVREANLSTFPGAGLLLLCPRFPHPSLTLAFPTRPLPPTAVRAQVPGPSQSQAPPTVTSPCPVSLG